MRFEYICHNCNHRFTSVVNATQQHVVCPLCQQTMTASNIDMVVDDSENQNVNMHSTVNQPQQRPVQARPVQARPVQARPVQARPVQAQPVQAQPVQAQPILGDTKVETPLMSQTTSDIPLNDIVEPVESDVEKTAMIEMQQEKSVAEEEQDTTSLQMSFNKALLESVEEDKDNDEHIEIADELKEAMDDTYEGVSKRRFNPVLMIVLAVVVALFVGVYFLFMSKDEPAEKTEMLVRNEKAAVQALKEFSQNNPDMNITQYFMLDLDQDGQKEVIANNDKNLIVFGAEDGAASLIYKKPVFEWVYLRGKGLFVVNTDEAQKKGSAVWLIKAKYTLVEDAHQENYHFSNGAYTKLLNGKETKVSEDDYYGFVNTIIKNYTKLTPLKL